MDLNRRYRQHKGTKGAGGADLEGTAHSKSKGG